MQQIAIQAVPVQQVKAVLGGQNCQINIYAKTQGVFVDLNSDGADVAIGVLAHDAVPLSPRVYEPFQGNLFFIDTRGSDDPDWTLMGTRFVLIYMTAAEFAKATPQNPNPPGPIDLLTTDDLIIIYTDDGDTIIVTHSV